jgi:hypothetical protein
MDGDAGKEKRYTLQNMNKPFTFCDDIPSKKPGV